MRRFDWCKLSLALLLACTANNAAADAPDRRSVSVSGRGQVEATPDRAHLAMSVDITRPDVRSAQAEVNRIVRAYLEQAHELGAHEDDLSTAGLSIRAEYDYSAKGGRKFLGYHVIRGIQLTVRDLDKIGDFLLHATDVGINDVSDPQLECSKADEFKRQALANAASDARAKAQVLADALGVKLGSVHTLNASTDDSPPPGPRPMLMKAYAAAADAGGNSEIGFSAGQITYTATLNAEFDLVVP